MFIGTIPSTRVQAEFADAVDDDALALLADALVLGFVLLDIAAVVAGDVQLGARRRGGDDREQQQAQKRDAHGEVTAKTFRNGTGLVGSQR
ncbi:hypothetical protein ACVWWR_007996 [Bradyrhizobium sp. LM3.2]